MKPPRLPIFTAIVFIVFMCPVLKSQDSAKIVLPKQKGQFYISWGYNKDWYSTSDLHFSDPGDPNAVDKTKDNSYDFTVYDVKAHDRPGFDQILKTDLSIPQYSYRIGYFLANNWGVEINFDHTKYIVTDYQTARVKGMIHGQYVDKDTVLDPMNFLHFEHTNGGNFLMLNGMRRFTFLENKNGKHKLGAVAKVGAGIVVPKTDVTLFGERKDNCFHIAGFVAGAEVGIRYEAFKYLFLEYTAKGAFANYKNVLVIGTGKANHHFWAFENILLLGVQIPL